jgi:hypothetical protein
MPDGITERWLHAAADWQRLPTGRDLRVADIRKFEQAWSMLATNIGDER